MMYVSLITLFNLTSADHLPPSFIPRTPVRALGWLRVIFFVFALVVSSHRKKLSAISCDLPKVS